jgi:hypothetical protein
MPTLDRIALKEAILVVAPGHSENIRNSGAREDIRNGGARYAKVLYGIREPLLDERWGSTALVAYYIIGFIFSYRYFCVPTHIVKLADSNVLGINQHFTETEPREHLKRVKSVEYARAYGATEEQIAEMIAERERKLTEEAIENGIRTRTLPCGCPSNHDHGHHRLRRYCLERDCHRCHLAVPEHWHTDDGSVSMPVVT